MNIPKAKLINNVFYQFLNFIAINNNNNKSRK